VAVGQNVVNEPNSEAMESYAKSYWQFEDIKIKLHLTKAVRVFLAPANRHYPIAWSEDRLKRVGCEYKTENSKEISGLVEILESGNLRPGRFSASDFEPRESIYLILGDSSEISLLFDRDYSDRPNLLGLNGGRQIFADNVIIERLYRWAAQFGGRAARCAARSPKASGRS
jgi:hypothetical protein